MALFCLRPLDANGSRSLSLFSLSPSESFLPCARENGSVENARNPFAAASSRDSRGLTDVPAWVIFGEQRRRDHLTALNAFLVLMGWRVTCENVRALCFTPIIAEATGAEAKPK